MTTNQKPADSEAKKPKKVYNSKIRRKLDSIFAMVKDIKETTKEILDENPDNR